MALQMLMAQESMRATSPAEHTEHLILERDQALAAASAKSKDLERVEFEMRATKANLERIESQLRQAHADLAQATRQLSEQSSDPMDERVCAKNETIFQYKKRTCVTGVVIVFHLYQNSRGEVGC